MNEVNTIQTMEDLMKSGFFKNVPKPGDIIEGKIIQATRGLLRIDIPGIKTGVIRGAEFFGFPECSNLKTGDVVQAMILNLDNERGELELSLKLKMAQALWEGMAEKKREKTAVDVQIIGANRGGLIISFQGIKGFLPVSQLSLEHYPSVPNADRDKILEKLASFVNQNLKVTILDIDQANASFIASEREAKGEDQKSLLAKYILGQVIDVRVTKLIDSGAFIEIEEGLTGFVHISELAWHYLPHPSSVVKIGEQFPAKIIAVEGEKVFLSRRKLIEDPWRKIEGKYQVGQKINGKILKISPFGFFVEVEPEIHGLAHISELSKELIKDLSSIAKIGDTLEFTINSFDPKEHRLGLSLIR